MRLKALDSFYSDETKMVADKAVFEVDSDALGQDFVKRGLAVELGGVEKDNVTAPANKDAGAAPSNKAAK